MSAGRRPGARDTRAEILAAARTEFASGGFGATTMRKVATAAGCDPALIHHYFGTKADLFRAAVNVPIDPSHVVDTISQAPLEKRGDSIIRAVLAVWDSPVGQALIAEIRTRIADTSQAVLVKEFVFSQMIGPATADLTGPDAAWRRNLVASQLIGVALARYVFAVEPMASMPPAAVADAVGPTLQRYLTGVLRRPGGGQ